MIVKSTVLHLRFCIMLVLVLASCAQTPISDRDNLKYSQLITTNNSLIAHCEKQIVEEHEMVTGELDEVLTLQQKLMSIRDEMQKKKGFNKDVLMILDNEIADIEMMFGEFKDGEGTIPAKHYLFFASYLRQTNANLQVFLDHK